MHNPTPWPWRRGREGTLVANSACSDEDLKYYGGKLVCESIGYADAGLILETIEGLKVALDTLALIHLLIEKGREIPEETLAISQKAAFEALKRILGRFP